MVFFFLVEDLDGAEFVTFLVFLAGLVGVGDLDVALEEAGVERRDRDELGVSERCSTESKYFGFCTFTVDARLLLPPPEGETPTVSCSSESIRRCVLDLRLELVRPVMILRTIASPSEHNFLPV